MEVKGGEKKISLTQNTVCGMQIYAVHLLSSKSS